MEQRGFMPCSKEELEELEQKPLSEDKLEKPVAIIFKRSYGEPHAGRYQELTIKRPGI